MHRIVIDTDGGVDDALALLYLVGSPEATIEAVTTVHGNVDVESATRSVLETLSVAGASASVFRGSSQPLEAEPVDAGGAHGDDGLGGWTHGRPLPTMQIADVPAWEAIPRIARLYPGELTLLTLGPLTNVALALREDTEGCRLLKRIVAMGGVTWEPGNMTPVAEFNIYVDPEAARVVVHSGIEITLVGLNVTRKALLTRDRLEEALGDRSDRRAQFLRCVCNQLFAFYGARAGRDLFFLHDPLAAALTLDSSLVETRRAVVDVETRGELTRGMVVADDRVGAVGAGNAVLCTALDSEKFIRMFSRRVLELNA
jgi:inosine-uridine nucleoside N-ribohydrolase